MLLKLYIVCLCCLVVSQCQTVTGILFWCRFFERAQNTAATMFEVTTVVLLSLIGLFIRLFHLASSPEKPRLFYKDPCSPFVQNLIAACPTLTSVYKPTFFWGKSGHLQTVVHAKMGRTNPKWPCSRRVHIKMADGATMSYDIFEPYKSGPKKKVKFTLAICPGIANSSECIYIRTFSSYAKSHSYRVAVLNHLGALKSEPLTSPRIFTYGGTEEYGLMIDDLRKKHPDGQILAVGFSMGGNIVSKYLGESPEHQRKVLCGISICQGYDILEVCSLLKRWSHMRRMYNLAMTLNVRRLLNRHVNLLFTEEAQKSQGHFNRQQVFKATSLDMIDKNYSYISAGFPDMESYYKCHSCSNYLHNIHIPMFFMNALDDPICPQELLKHAKNYTESHEYSLYATTKHGGHLGYFEGGIFIPDDVTWLDRLLMEYADAITDLYLQGKLPNQTDHPLFEKSSHKHDNKSETQSQEVGKNLTGSQKCVDVKESLTTSKNSEHLREINTNIARVDNETFVDLLGIHGSKGDGKEEEVVEKRGSLKRGIYLQQTTSYVQ